MSRLTRDQGCLHVPQEEICDRTQPTVFVEEDAFHRDVAVEETCGGCLAKDNGRPNGKSPPVREDKVDILPDQVSVFLQVQLNNWPIHLCWLALPLNKLPS